MEGVEPILFQDFCEIFLSHHFVEKSPKYKRSVYYQIQRQFLPRFGSKEMSAITLEEIVAWKEKREAENVAPKTVREDLALLHLIFKAAIKNSYASKNPVDDIEYPRCVPNKIRTAVPDEKLVKVLRLMTGLDLCIVLLLRNTGLRLGELFRLNREDFDFENKIVRVRSVQGATTKNYQSRETVLTPTVATILRSLPIQGPLFPIKQRTFEARFYKLKKRHGVDWDVHSLRHAFVTKLRNTNIPERVVAHYVGHAQKNVTDRYTSYTKEFVEASIKAVDFGSEFLRQTDNVVTFPPKQKLYETDSQVDMPSDSEVSKWSPEKGAYLEPIKTKGNLAIKTMPGAGIEPARLVKVTGF